MRRIKHGKWIFIAAMALFVCLVAETASAIPLFARKYKLSCVMCHTGFPQLNNFGANFAQNGYQMPDEDPKDYVEEIEENKLLLHQYFPFAIRVDSFFRARNDTEVTTDIEAPFSAKVLTSGTLRKDIAYYFYFFFDERGGVTGIEDAFLYLNSFLGIENFDLRFGQFQITDSLFPREQRLTFQDYTYYTTPVSDSGFNLVYDRAIEANYNFNVTEDWNVGLLAGISNGNGIGNANNERNFDSNGFKNFYGRGTLGYGNQTVGVYAYHGQEDDPRGVASNFYRIGPDFNFTIFEDWNIWGSYLYGEDRNGTFQERGPEGDIQSWGGFVGVTKKLGDDWILSFLHNIVEVNEKPQLDANTITANLTYYLMRNLKLMFELTGDLQGVSPLHSEKTHTGEFGIVFAY